MKKYNKGTTLIEIMISVLLISIVLVFLFNILLDLKKEKDLTARSGEDSIKRSSYTRLVQNDFIQLGLSKITGCNDGSICFVFHYNDASNKKFIVYDNYVVYDDEKWQLSDNNQYQIHETTFCYSEKGNNSFLKINVPVTQVVSSNKKLDVELTNASNHKINIESLTIPSEYIKCKANSSTAPPDDPEEPEEVGTDAYFDKGSVVNEKMKKLAGNSSATYTSEDTAITSFVRSTTISDENKTEANIVSTTSSPVPIYMWYESGIIKWYARANNIYLNADSSSMFYNLKSVTSLDLSKFDSSNVTTMEQMFKNDSSLGYVNVSNFSTPKVTNIKGLFYDCTNLTEIDLRSFNLSSVTVRNDVINGCSALTHLMMPPYPSGKTWMIYFYKESPSASTEDGKYRDMYDWNNNNYRYGVGYDSSTTLGTGATYIDLHTTRSSSSEVTPETDKDGYYYWRDTSTYTSTTAPSIVYSDYNDVVTAGTPTSLMRTKYVNNAVNEHSVCLYYNNKITCIEYNYWRTVTGANAGNTTSASQVSAALKSKMQTDLSATPTCEYNAALATCYYQSNKYVFTITYSGSINSNTNGHLCNIVSSSNIYCN